MKIQFLPKSSSLCRSAQPLSAVIAVTMAFTATLRADHFSASLLQENSGVWEQDGAWSTGAYPNNGHTIPDSQGNPIPGPNPTYDVVLGVRSVCTLGIFARVQAVNVLKGSTLNVGPAGYLWANTGFGNAGLITLKAAGNFTGLLRASANSNVVQGGEIFMSDSNSNSVTAGSPGAVLTISAGGRIRGAGNINAYHGDDIRTYFKVVNHGLIDALQPTNRLDIHLTPEEGVSPAFVNDGTLSASKQGVLRISLYGAPAEVVNTGGVIRAIDNGAVRVAEGVVISGGTLATSGNGTIRGDYASLSGGGILRDLTNTGIIASSTGEMIRISGTIVNNGTVRLGGDNGNLLVTGGDAVLAGNGLVSMTGKTPTIAGGDFVGRRLTVGPHATIRAKGEISTPNSNFTNKALALTNHGMIETISSVNIVADGANGGVISNPDGRMRANGAGSVMQFSGNGPVNNDGGIIAALNGGTVRIANGVTVTGGTFVTSGTGTIRCASANNGGTLKNVTNDGTIELTGSELLYAANRLTNKGLIHLEGSGAGLLIVGGDLLLDGAGEVVMSPQGGNQSIAGGDQIGRTLTLGPAATIRGGGFLGTNNSNFGYKAMNTINHGLIESTSGLTHLFDSNGLSAINAGGTFRASNGSTLGFQGPAAVANNNGGVIEALADSTVSFNSGATFTNNAGGTIKLNGGTIDAAALGLDLKGGRLIGNGIFTGAIRNTGGTVAPGFSSGKITINGNYNQGANGVLSMEIGGGPATTNYDRVEVNGTASIGGVLQVWLRNGFIPAASAKYTIVATQNLIEGNFKNVASGARLPTKDGAGSFIVTYRVVNNALLSRDVTLSNFKPSAQPNDTSALSAQDDAEPEAAHDGDVR